MSRNVKLGQEQERICLELIGRFDWLRLQEISMFLWPDSEVHRYHYAQSLIKKLLAQNLVFTQKMPKHAGTAVVLTVKGAKTVRSMGHKKVTSATLFVDDQGNTAYEVKARWEHDLMVHGFAAIAFQSQEFSSENFLTEREQGQSTIENNRFLYAENDDHIKLTDILIKNNSLGMIGIEFEKSRKSGEKRDALIKNLVQTNKKDGKTIHNFNGIEPSKIAIAYNPAEKEKTKDGKTKKINHLKNIFNATLKKMAEENVNELDFIFIELQIKNFGVIGYKMSNSPIITVNGIPNCDPTM